MPRAPTSSRSLGGAGARGRSRSESRFRVPSAADVAMMDDAQLDAAFPSREAPTLPVKKPLDPIPSTSRPGSSSDDATWRLHQQFAATLGSAGVAPGASLQNPMSRDAAPEELIAQLSDVEGRTSAATKLDGMLRRERVAGGTEAHAALVSRLVASGVVPPLVTALSSQRPPTAAEAAAALVRSLAVSSEAKAALLRAGAIVPLVRLIEAPGGSTPAQDALDRLAMCDGAVKAQIEAAQSREGAAARVDALRHAQQRRAAAAAAAAAASAVGGFAAGDGGAEARDEEADEIGGLLELAADAEEAAQVAAAGGIELLVARVASGASGGTSANAVAATAGASARAVEVAARALCVLAEHASLRTALATARATPALVALLAAGSGPGGGGGVDGDAAALLATPLARAWAAAALCTLARSQAPKQEALALGAMRPLLALLDAPVGGADEEVAVVLEQVRRLAPGTLLPGLA